MDIPVRELKARLSEYLRRVRRGEEIRVTYRGRAIARITAVMESPQPPTIAELERRLHRIPGLRPGRGGKPRGARKPLQIRRGGRTLSDIVLEERD